MIDSHCHINDAKLLPRITTLIDHMHEAGVIAALVVGSDLPSSRSALQLAQEYPSLFRAAVGVHPHESMHLDDATLTALREMAQDPLVVAIGEIGLDYHYDFSPRSVQRTAFRCQIELAREVALPLIIHERAAVVDVLSILDAVDGWGVGGVWHCCSVTPEEATRIATHFYLGIAGWITFPKGENIRQIARAVPLERLLVETDAPYITPAPFRGTPNEPARVQLTAQALAVVKEVSLAVVDQDTTKNTLCAFPRWREGADLEKR